MSDKASILFVDDEKRVLNAMRGLFRRKFNLYLTTEGKDAVEIAAKNSIDVIVADQRMPGMTGTEVLGRVKELSPRTVRILLTGYADPSAVEGSINVGEVFRFLSKPCHPKLLRETIDLAIAASRTAPAVTRQEPVAVSAANDADQGSAETRQPPAATDNLAAGRYGAEDESHLETVTEIVLSGDTSQIRQQPGFEAPPAMNTKDVGVVIFTIDSEFAEFAIRAVSVDRKTTLATSLGKVAETIEEKQAGVLITDFTTNRTVLQKMIGVLKHQLPELVTIVVSDSRDTTDMITLINHGQVFRYVLKPVDPQSLRNEINAAAMRHLHLSTHPEALLRHQVEKTEVQRDPSPTLEHFVGRIQSVRANRTDPTTGSY